MTVGASYSPAVLQGLTWAQIAADLGHPSSPVAQGVLGTANVITASICSMTGNQPASACTPAIAGLEKQLYRSLGVHRAISQLRANITARKTL
jgi:hypothetical protein